MGPNWKKRDRTARLLKIQVLLGQNPAGLKIEEIARSCSVNVRTVYRDLKALESELNVPIWQHGEKRGVVAGYNLPAIPFTLAEAMNIFLAVRLMQNYSRWYDPNIASTFMKLNYVVPPLLRTQIQNTINWVEQQPKNEKYIHIFETLIKSWVSQHRVTIWYQDLSDKEPIERLIEPYYIEPTTHSHASYVIAYCHLKKTICSIKINRIENIRIESGTYIIPLDFNAIDYLSSAWEIFVGGPVETVKLRFSSRLSRPIQEARWHASQIMEPQKDGSLIMTLRVNNTYDFRSWILGWGDEVEVLEPENLRSWMIGLNKSISKIYTSKELPSRPMQSDKNPSPESLELTNDQWKIIKDRMPHKSWTGRPRANDREIINGILWVLRTGCRWIDIPRKYGSYSTCYSRYQAWKKQGTWDSIQHIVKP
ncbi:MAG: WYL domain-containing protein [Dehalococcoidales bacterium]|nr:WYL domain-containing protein [Dehalococcoidales bacterium]